jgi:gamma-glutamyltranspeptidase/glutathione hydrolase
MPLHERARNALQHLIRGTSLGGAALLPLLLHAAGAPAPAADATSAAATPAAASAARAAAVAAPDEFAAHTAMDVMKHGGNAVDAAVATAFVLAVTYPEAGNLGGGGFMMIHENGENVFLDYRETAPAAATRDMYLDAKGEVIKDWVRDYSFYCSLQGELGH